MEEENSVKLHGMWASTYVKRVELALKAKGIGRAVTTDEEAQEKAVEELLEKMNIFKEEMKKLFPDGDPVINQVKDLGLLDILMNATFSPYKAQEKVIGKTILDSQRNPLIFSWVATTS
ncbi:hypothetical protein RCOM_1515080 [Ricinus communis]|uniref:Uncharacterized protein n=1 Tax=Ricinus communis TaxID=3988 RepID=B9R9A0_RICCO|nr:hypothetical protein RCOM_1515080 [Ricinus communis]